MALRFIVFWGLLSAFGNLYAQRFRMDQVSARAGLSSDQVLCLFQDQWGFIWIGTTDGLNRYDGSRYQVFKYVPGDTSSIASNVITCLYEDRSGALWVGTANGISRYVRETDRFVSFVHNPVDTTSIGPGGVSSFYEDSYGQFWVTTANGGLQELDRERGMFRQVSPAPRYRDQYLFTSTIQPDVSRKGRFWIALRTQDAGWELFLFDARSKTFEQCAVGTVPFRGYVWNIFDDRNGTLWFVASNGLFPFDPQSKTFRNTDTLPEVLRKMQKTWLFSACLGPDGRFWIGTGKEGLFAVDPTTGHVTRFDTDPAGSGVSIGNKTIIRVLHDRSGVVWAGAINGGLYQIRTESRPFRLIMPDTSKVPSSLTANSVTAFLEDRSGRIWIGMDDKGVHLFDGTTGRLKKGSEVYAELAIQETFSIYSLCETQDGRIWIGTNSRGLVCFDPNRRTALHYQNNPADSTSLSADYVHALLEDRQGNLWVGTNSGLDRFNPQTGSFEHARVVADGRANDFRNFIQSLCEDRDGNLWVGTLNGLALLHRSTGAVSHYLQIDDSPTAQLPVYAVAQDRRGVIWAGTAAGLYRLEPSPAQNKAKPGQTFMVHRYTEADGLANQRIFGLLIDDQGRIWVSTPSGVSVFRNPDHAVPVAPVFKNYDAQDGLQTDLFATGATLKGRSGLCYFGGVAGFNVFDPDSIRESTYQPPIVITVFEKFNTDNPDLGAVFEPGITVRKQVTLSHKNNIFTIEFAALDYRAPENCRYAYRMLGFSDNWVQLGPQRRVTFTNLNPGTYTFEVRGTNSDGIWSDRSAVLKIVITPPWWKTVWAYLAYALLFAAGIAGFIRLRLRFLENRTRQLEQAVRQSTAQILEQKDLLEKQAEELQELDRLKSRFFANITHELRTPLTLMLGPLNTVLKNWKADPTHRKMLQIAQENGRKLLHLVSEILDLGKLDADRMTVEAKPVPVQELLARLVAQFDSHAGYLGVRLAFRGDLPPGTVVLLDAKKFETVVNNLLSNALKFTPPGGSVTVLLTKQSGALLLSVQDTGRGIHPDDLPHVFDRYFQTKRPDTPVEGGTGIGLALSAELVRLCGGRIWVESRVGGGSVFWVEWPGPAPGILADVPTQGEAGLWSVPPVEHSEVEGQAVSGRGNGRVAGVLALPTEVQDIGKEADPAVRILVAEDNPDLQQYLLHLLAPEYDVVVVANGEEALAWLGPTSEGREAGADLIISDIMMPRMDGFQLLEALKNDDRYRHIPVVMLTARADMQDKLRALRIGVDDYLTKPFDEEELLTRVRNLVGRQQLRAATTRDDDPNSNLKPQTSKLETSRISQADAEWLAELEAWTLANLKDDLLTVTAMAQQMALSERQLLRRLKALTGLAPQQYIAEMRLQKAREALERGVFRTVAEAAYAAGFNNAKAFSRAYRERFGRLPSSYF